MKIDRIQSYLNEHKHEFVTKEQIAEGTGINVYDVTSIVSVISRKRQRVDVAKDGQKRLYRLHVESRDNDLLHIFMKMGRIRERVREFVC